MMAPFDTALLRHTADRHQPPSRTERVAARQAEEAVNEKRRTLWNSVRRHLDWWAGRISSPS